ncbi:hypothetical protein TrVE_jg3634 [Triparma verrucosa]|uniref:PA domain-containing protein n=1 Tax=Triparma verrucosa TaxID=1606542 RepID=A0A9W7EW50_9STRA|nr:hypothetical protein TrVE_jg3634 [Triparma verrucosa]
MKSAPFVVLTGLLQTTKAILTATDVYLEIGRGTSARPYTVRPALYGTYPYETIEERVVVLTGDLCSPLTAEETAGWGSSPFILMVNRGTCSFKAKTLRAQEAGSLALIVMDDKCVCEDEQSAMCHSDGPCKSIPPMMGDDVTAPGTATIPTVLIKKQDGEFATEYLMSDHCTNFNCPAKFSFRVPAPDDRVEWELFEGSSWYPDAETYGRTSPLLDFLPYVQALGDSAYFTPHYQVFEGLPPREDCHSGMFGSCSTLCTNHGRYCAYDPDGLGVGNTGADVVAEALRRLCIWKHYSVGVDVGTGPKWWQYNLEFLNQCDNRLNYPSTYDWTCASNVMLSVGIDKAVIEDCMEESGGTVDATENTLLQNEVEAWKNAGVTHEVSSEIGVNSVAISGAVTPQKTFAAICHGILDGTWPEVCTKCASCESYMEGCVKSSEFTCGPVDGPSAQPTPSPTDGGVDDENEEEDEDGGFLPDFDIPGLPDFSHCTEGDDQVPGACSGTESWHALQAIQKFQDCSDWQLQELLPALISSIAGLQEVADECGADGDDEEDGDRLLRSLRILRSLQQNDHGRGLQTGEDVCENDFFNEDQCKSIGCCEWDGVKCESAIGSDKCVSGQTKQCTDAATAFLMNSEITPYFLDIANHPLHYCSCTSELGDSLPACVISLPGQDDVDLSMLKTVTCIMGDDCDWLEESCGPMLDLLEICLESLDCNKKCVLPIDEAEATGQNAFWCLEDENKHVDGQAMAALTLKMDEYRAACATDGEEEDEGAEGDEDMREVNPRSTSDGWALSTPTILGVLALSVIGFIAYKKVSQGGRRGARGGEGEEGVQVVTMNILRERNEGGGVYGVVSKEEEEEEVGGGTIVQATAASFEI